MPLSEFRTGQLVPHRAVPFDHVTSAVRRCCEQTVYRSLYAAVGIATTYEMGGPGIESR